MEISISPSPEISHTFQRQEEVNLSDFPQGETRLVEAIDLSDLSQFCSAAQEGLTLDALPELLRYCSNTKVKDALKAIVETGKIQPVTSSALPKEAYHAGCSLFVDSRGHPIDKIVQTRDVGFYGAEDKVSYFGVDRDVALIHGLGNFNHVTQRRTRYPNAKVILLTLDTKKLTDVRNVFPDPESLLPAFEHEFGQNFIVHSGIPVSAIKKMEVFNYGGYQEK
ncbi:MAG: hypothetical protein WC657_05990 [Candidatus Paceibacterota bacterium]|jgi:hypothetical protein